MRTIDSSPFPPSLFHVPVGYTVTLGFLDWNFIVNWFYHAFQVDYVDNSKFCHDFPSSCVVYTVSSNLVWATSPLFVLPAVCVLDCLRSFLHLHTRKITKLRELLVALVDLGETSDTEAERRATFSSHLYVHVSLLV